MNLQPGQVVSHYRLVAKIGEGGMGLVWKAEDATLRRPVALKFLTADSLRQEDRRARFLREARLAAALNHPNICTIYEVGEAPSDGSGAFGSGLPPGTPFIAMEFIDGRSLAETLREKSFLQLQEALRVAAGISDALVAAHARGIAHRDLKPGNVMISREGLVKVLDFGLAKPLATAGKDDAVLSQAETISEELTRQGMVVGTSAYMSPEQATGDPIDTRSDIFSFGILLYEMIAGQRPFSGRTASATRLKIIEAEPDPLPPGRKKVPVELERILLRCLRKKPEARYNDTRDLAVVIRDLLEETTSGRQMRLSPDRVARSRMSTGLRIGSAALIAAAAALAGWLVLRGDRVAGPPAFPQRLRRVTSAAGPESWPSLSPDGKTIVYSAFGPGGDADIFSQRVDGTRAIDLTEGSRGADLAPAFSPDGKWIAFTSGEEKRGIFIMGATGESPRRLTEFGSDPAWSPDGASIAFSSQMVGDPRARGPVGELWVADVASGETRRIFAGDAVQPRWSPHGYRIAYWAVPVAGATRDVWTIPAAGGEPVPVTNDDAVDWNPVWSPDGGHLYFASDRGESMNLWRVAIDERTGAVLGEPEGITAGGTTSKGFMSLDAAGSKLAYSEELEGRSISKVGFDPATESVIGDPVPVTRGSVLTVYPDVSPDGEWVAYATQGARQDLFVIRTDGSGMRQLTDDVFRDWCPRWSADGNRIFFHSDRSGNFEIWSIRPDGSDARLHPSSPDGNVTNPVVSPDGTRIAYYDWETGGAGVFTLDGEGSVWNLPLSEEGLGLYPSSWSPDGRTLLGISREEAGRSRGIYTFSLGPHTYRRVMDGDSFARWMSDSRRIVFTRRGEIMLRDTETGREKTIISMLPYSKLGHAAIAPDDTAIYFEQVTLESDIWLLESD